MHYHPENHTGHPTGVVSHHPGNGTIPVGPNCPASDFLCCGLLLTGLLAWLNPRLAFVCVLAIGAIIIIACLASLAMSVTGETLLSLFLIGLVITGLAMLCDRNNVGCCPQERADNHDNLNHYHFRT